MRSFCQEFFLDYGSRFQYSGTMAKLTYNTRVERELIKKFKILAIELDKRQNQLLEEAIQDLLKKYEKKSPAK